MKEALHLAQRGKVDELAALVGEIPDLVERAPYAARLLQSATVTARLEMVEWLLDHGVDVDAPSPLPVRLTGGALELVLFATPLCLARMTRWLGHQRAPASTGRQAGRVHRRLPR